MYWRYWGTNLWLNVGWELAHWRRRVALFWYGGDKTPWLFVSIALFVVGALAFGLRSTIAYQDERRKRVREFHQQSLTCLARNVYFEARGEPIAGQSLEQITDRVMTLEEGTRFMVLAPLVRGRKGEYGKLLEEMRGQGYARAVIDGELRRLDEPIDLDKKYKHDISIVVDRLVMKEGLRKRLAESLEAASQLGEGLVEEYAPPMVESRSKNYLTMALEEVAQERLDWHAV